MTLEVPDDFRDWYRKTTSDERFKRKIARDKERKRQWEGLYHRFGNSVFYEYCPCIKLPCGHYVEYVTYRNASVYCIECPETKLYKLINNKWIEFNTIRYHPHTGNPEYILVT